jgi:hypothetical protein
MLFAKALSILFSLFAGLESAKGALYHYVCGKGKDRVFPYLAEIKQYIKDDVLFYLKSVRTLEISTKTDILVIFKQGFSHWKDDLFFSVGGFTVNTEIKTDGVYLHLQDYYDWHSNKDWDYSWTIPNEFLEKIPNVFKTLIKNHLHPIEDVNGWIVQEIHFSSFGQSYWHKGTIFYSWEELGIDLSYAVGRIGASWKYDCFSYTFKDDYGMDIVTCPNQVDINIDFNIDIDDINIDFNIDIDDINIDFNIDF